MTDFANFSSLKQFYIYLIYKVKFHYNSLSIDIEFVSMFSLLLSLANQDDNY